MSHHHADSTAELLLQAHRAAIDQAIVLCRSAARYWIHRQSCEYALVSTYKHALQKLINVLSQPLLSQHLNAEQLQLLIQPSLAMVLVTIQQGVRFLESCRPDPPAESSSVRHRSVASSSSSSLAASSDGEDTFPSRRAYTSTDDKSWLLSALLQGCATDAIEVHLHDFLIAFSAVCAAIEDLQYVPYRMAQHSADWAPSPDLFWREQNRPHVLLVSAQQLDRVKHHDDTVLNFQLEIAMNLRGGSPDVGTLQQQMTTIRSVAEDGPQLAAFVKEKIRCANQTFNEGTTPSFLDIRELEVIRSINVFSVEYRPSVHMVMWLGRMLALKVYNKDVLEHVFLQEAMIHVRLHHPNVLHAVALCQGKKECGILMELMDESLKEFLQRYAGSLRLQEKVSIMLQIAKGMAYVHERGVIHRDIKPSNVLVRSSSDTHKFRIQQIEVKIADFGESNLTRLPDASSFMTKRVGTTVYRAPELLNDNKDSSKFTAFYKKSADVYSYGMTSFELLVEKEPFHESERNQALWDRMIEGERPDLASISNDVCPPYLKHCLETWWADDPQARHSFTHICCILRHVYMCLVRCRMDTEPMVQFPFLAWPYWRWKHAQELAQQRLREWESRRESEDWKEKGNRCESTRVNEIPYELHVMDWAIKQAAEYESEEAASVYMSGERPQASPDSVSSATASLVGSGNSTGAPARGCAITRAAPSTWMSFGRNLQEFFCLSPHITPSNHKPFR